jgi:single-stranded DNA-binding protein
MNLNQLTVATKKSWKDEADGWKEKTQWHSVVAFGEGFAKSAGRLVKGAHVFVQGELATREYDRTITIRKGKETIEHVIPQLVVELRADSIRILDRRNSGASLHRPVRDEECCSGGSFSKFARFVWRRNSRWTCRVLLAISPIHPFLCELPAHPSSHHIR